MDNAPKCAQLLQVYRNGLRKARQVETRERNENKKKSITCIIAERKTGDHLRKMPDCCAQETKTNHEISERIR